MLAMPNGLYRKNKDSCARVREAGRYAEEECYQFESPGLFNVIK